MSKLYVDMESYGTKKCAKALTEKLGKAIDANRTINSIMSDCTEFFDFTEAYEDTRNNYFIDEDFKKSAYMKQLKRKAEETSRLAVKLYDTMYDLKEQMEFLEFEYSEDLNKWLEEERKYDYERA